ncbi:MAG TPA: glycosyltransferase, partial [Candidatus Limnocylindrales bacterium]|nr:glycosyltransferase [Candidatus Limnocylindrales bacterium]
GIPFRRLWLRSLRSTELDLHAMLDPLRLAVSIPQATAMLARRRPDAILSTGGYVAIPTLVAATLLRVPALLWEGNLVPGRSTRLAARFARLVTVSFTATCERLSGVRTCLTTGTPVRAFPGGDRVAARARLELPADRPCLLVFGGSQQVRRFDAALDAALPRLVERATVVHVAGQAGLPAALARRHALAEPWRSAYRPFAFLGTEMADALVAADLVVGRAGSSTLAEVAAAGRPMIVVPYPHAAGHQRANAAAMAAAGAARLVPDEAFDGSALIDAAALLDDPPRLAAMAAAARRLGRPGAASATAELLLALAAGRPLPSAEAIERLAAGVA